MIAATVAATIGGLVLCGVIVGAIVWGCRRLGVVGKKGESDGKGLGKREKLFCEYQNNH